MSVPNHAKALTESESENRSRSFGCLRFLGSGSGFFGVRLLLENGVLVGLNRSQSSELGRPSLGPAALLIGGLVLGGSDLVFLSLLLVGLDDRGKPS
jgi:hypothetical protein